MTANRVVISVLGGYHCGQKPHPLSILIKANWGPCFIEALDLNAWAKGAAQNSGIVVFS